MAFSSRVALLWIVSMSSNRFPLSAIVNFGNIQKSQGPMSGLYAGSVSRFDTRTLRTQRQQQYVRQNCCARRVVCQLFAVVLWVFSGWRLLVKERKPVKTQNFDILSMSFWSVWGGKLFHASFKQFQRPGRLVGFRSLTRRSNSSYNSSMGFKSGDSGGHFIILGHLRLFFVPNKKYKVLMYVSDRYLVGK